MRAVHVSFKLEKVEYRGSVASRQKQRFVRAQSTYYCFTCGGNHHRLGAPAEVKSLEPLWMGLCARSISIQGIMEHPWYNTPMRTHYEDALARLKQEQDEVEEKVGRVESKGSV